MKDFKVYSINIDTIDEISRLDSIPENDNSNSYIYKVMSSLGKSVSFKHKKSFRYVKDISQDEASVEVTFGENEIVAVEWYDPSRMIVCHKNSIIQIYDIETSRSKNVAKLDPNKHAWCMALCEDKKNLVVSLSNSDSTSNENKLSFVWYEIKEND